MKLWSLVEKLKAVDSELPDKYPDTWREAEVRPYEGEEDGYAIIMPRKSSGRLNKTMVVAFISQETGSIRWTDE